MAKPRGFDEVMIINPYDPAMPGVGMYAEPGAMAYYNEYPQMGWAGDPAYGLPDLGWYGAGYGAAEPIGYYAADPLAGYGQWPLGYAGYGAEPYGEPFFGYGEWGQPIYGAEPLGEWGEPYYGEPVYGEPMYGEPMYGEPMYGEPVYGEPMYGEPYADIADYGAGGEMVGYGLDPTLGGYVRDVPSPFNAGCPLPTNVSGVGEVEGFEGYEKPRHVSPTVTAFTAADVPMSMPEAFRPLW
jgi:hypothetical protein